MVPERDGRSDYAVLGLEPPEHFATIGFYREDLTVVVAGKHASVRDHRSAQVTFAV